MKIMTINQFLQNPVGKGSASGARRDVIISNLQQRYSKLYKENKKLFRMSVFVQNNQYFFVFKIPSETFSKEKLTYDVVIQLIPIGSAAKDLTLNRYAVKVFSNAPNFMFTYAYVYNQDDIIIDFLKKKLPQKALTQSPDIRNPDQTYGFEKSVYFALLYITTNKQVTKSMLTKNSSLNISVIQRNVMSAEEKLEEYNRLKTEAELKKEKEKKKINKERIKKGLPPEGFKSVYRKRHVKFRNDIKRSTDKRKKVRR